MREDEAALVGQRATLVLKDVETGRLEAENVGVGNKKINQVGAQSLLCMLPRGVSCDSFSVGGERGRRQQENKPGGGSNLLLRDARCAAYAASGCILRFSFGGRRRTWASSKIK